MKQRMKRAVAFICAGVMTISSCLVDGALTSKASESVSNSGSETESHTVIKFNNPGIGMNVGDKIDLTKYDVQFEDGQTTEAKDLTWYGSSKTYTIPYASPAIPANVGDIIDLSSYKVEFEKGTASVVDTWKNGNQTINVLKVEETGVYQLTAKSGDKTKNIYVVAKNASDSEYVLYYNGFGAEDGYTTDVNNGDIISYNDFVNVTDDPNNPNYLTKIRTSAPQSSYEIDSENGLLSMDRSAQRVSANLHLLLPTWLGEFGDYSVEMQGRRVNYDGKNDSFIGIDLRAQYDQNIPSSANDYLSDSSPYKTAYLEENYFLKVGENKKSAFVYSDQGKADRDLKTTEVTSNDLSVNKQFVLSVQMNGDTISYQISQDDAVKCNVASTKVSGLPDTGRIGIYGYRMETEVNYIKVSLNHLPSVQTSSENTEITSFTATATGVTPLVVKDKNNNAKTIYVVVKNENDTEYVLWENNFNSQADLPYDMGVTGDYDGFARLYGKPTVTLNEAKGTLDIKTTTQGHYRFPEWLGEFGNYRVQMTATTESYKEDTTQIGLFARAQDTGNYTPNYTVLLRYKGYASDAIALKVRKPYSDTTKKSYESNIAWGKTISMRVGTDAREYTHELLVQDDLIEYKINDKTRLYDIREREFKKGYVGFQIEENLNISIDNVRVLFIPDIEAPDAPVSAEYNRTTSVAGMADGNVTVQLADTGSAARDILCYWGNGTDVLNGYTHFGKGAVETGKTEATVELGKNIMIPDGATEIRVYTENSAGRSEECVCVPLPSGVTSLKTGAEVMSFQVISDTHITKSETGYASVNFKKFLEKVLVNDSDSTGIWIGGDLVDKGNPEEYQNFQNIWDKVEDELGKELPDMHAIIGNHEFWGTNENNDTGKNTYKETMTLFNQFTGNSKVYFSEEINGYNFIYLATSELEDATRPGSHTNAVLGDAQVKWLEQTLNAKAEDDKPIFIFLHQPLNETVAGSGTSGVKEHAEIKEILKKYPQAVLFTSHSHMNLDEPNTMLSSEEGLCNMFNTSAISYLMKNYSDKAVSQDGAQAYYVEVYQDMLLVRGKDVVNDKWLPSSQFVIFLEGHEAPAPVAPSNDVYETDFNNYVNLTDLNEDYDAYTLGEVGENTVEVNVEDAFVSADKGLRRNAKKVGTDTSGFSILTLTKQQYKNFEAELTYGQSWERYGIMFGGEPGEFVLNLQNDLIKATNGVAFAYTEAEGYRNIKGALTAGMASSANNALKRVATKLDSFVNSSGSATNNVNKEKLHTMKIRVVGDWMTMIVDGDEDSRVTVRIDGYGGGYISLVSNGNTKKSGVFNYLKITALGDDAQLGCETPEEKDGFTALSEMKNDFDAYYLADASKSSSMQKVEFLNNWWFNKQGYLARFKSGNGSETKKVDVLTYNKKSYTNFQLDFEYQQTYNRTGVIIGGQQGVFPIGYKDDEMLANGGVMLFLEAEGDLNAMGAFTNGYTDKSNLRRRLTTVDLPGFLDDEGNAGTNVDAKKVHHITIVVKDKELYLFVDGSDRCAMYLTLPEDYAGGYISLFSAAPKEFGIDKFVISETITKTIPQKEKLVTKNGNEVNIDFNVDVPDETGLSAYYFSKLNKTGTMEKRDLYANWMIANGKLNKQSYSVGSNDTEKVTVLTYTEEKYENFVATFEYQLTRGRLMLLFGTEEGKFPLYNKNGNHENGGVMLYAEADLGSGGGICALGDVKLATEGTSRPMYRELSYAPDYYVKKDNGELKAGVKYTMTVAVYNKHCSVYIDGFGLVSSFDLSDDYKEGYISLASTNTKQHGFTFLNIRRIDDANAIKDVSQIRDITVQTGAAKESISLPGTVEVTNAAGQKVNVPVEWKDRGYDASVAGEYEFVGTLQMTDGMTNPGMMTALLTVRVRDELPKTSKTTKMWTFDTASDLLDFKSFYIKNAKKDKPVAEAGPLWFVKNGRLLRDQNRASQGSETSKLSILTYTGAKYKNFELEVDFSQQYAREMILFGSKTPGQYFNYEDAKSKDNPIAVFVEFEGRRNAMGNVANTNFYNRTSTSISNAREDYAENNNYYDKTKKEDKAGTMHHLKLRVVGDTFTVWLDDQKTVFSGKIGEGYEGGYISLVSTAQKGKFDNLKITRLNEQGKPITENQEVVATGHLDVAYNKLEKPEEPQVLEPIVENNINIGKIAIIAAPIVALGATLTVVGTVAKKNKTKKKEGNS